MTSPLMIEKHEQGPCNQTDDTMDNLITAM